MLRLPPPAQGGASQAGGPAGTEAGTGELSGLRTVSEPRVTAGPSLQAAWVGGRCGKEGLPSPQGGRLMGLREPPRDRPPESRRLPHTGPEGEPGPNPGDPVLPKPRPDSVFLGMVAPLHRQAWLQGGGLELVFGSLILKSPKILQLTRTQPFPSRIPDLSFLGLHPTNHHHSSLSNPPLASSSLVVSRLHSTHRVLSPEAGGGLLWSLWKSSPLCLAPCRRVPQDPLEPSRRLLESKLPATALPSGRTALPAGGTPRTKAGRWGRPERP